MSFHAQVELLQQFLGRRDAIVACIERLLNCQKKPLGFQQDFSALSRQFKACFAVSSRNEGDETSLDDLLQHAHWADGFKPRAQPGNDVVDPVEQMVRGFHMWRQTHWPGQKGRVRFAQTLFNLYLLRCLVLLCMRLWDEDASAASVRLSHLQAVLDALWRSSPADQPRLVRNVCWLFPVAMSPTTDSLDGYLPAAQRIAETLAEPDRVEAFKAWVQTGAGHLNSQLYHLAKQRGVPLDDNALVLITRMSNALDLALLVQGLVPLLEAYERSVQRGNDDARHALASAICQGIAPDPHLFVNRLDLLGPYSMIEHLCVTTHSDDQAAYTATGTRHLALLERYAALITRLAPSLYEDCQRDKPADHAWSPYGTLYGFASNLIELMAFKTLQRDATTQFSMEDIFTNGGQDKLVWINGWRDLPHIKPEVVKQFEYPRQFAEDIHARIEQALQRRVAGNVQPAAGRLFIAPEAASQVESTLAQIPDLPLRYIVSSDPQLVAARKAESMDEGDLVHCRMEGEFVVSYATPGGWAAITKDMLTDVLGNARDAKITGLPPAAASVLSAMCPGLVRRQDGKTL